MNNVQQESESPPPFFVIGSPRSGTTLLRLMLTSHPRLVIPPECGFMLWLRPQFGNWRAAEFADPDHRSQFAAAVSASRKFETWAIAPADVERALADCHPSDYVAACAGIYRRYCASMGKASAIWGDKNNYYLGHIDELKDMFPEARYIHIVRDGRDVACSYREVMATGSDSPYRPALPTAIADIARQWAADVRTIRGQLAAMADATKIELRYEDLTADPQTELSRICRWLGLPFDDRMLQFHHANQSDHLEPAITMDWKRRTLEPVNPGTVGRYKSLLSEAEAKEFESIAAAELKHYRYLS